MKTVMISNKVIADYEDMANRPSKPSTQEELDNLFGDIF